MLPCHIGCNRCKCLIKCAACRWKQVHIRRKPNALARHAVSQRTWSIFVRVMLMSYGCAAASRSVTLRERRRNRYLRAIVVAMVAAVIARTTPVPLVMWRGMLDCFVLLDNFVLSCSVHNFHVAAAALMPYVSRVSQKTGLVLPTIIQTNLG